eukprot:gb/GECG01005273.1/.p1 GENE.gb/GECG01005273.1/~~gb/GECG01005273.1/.p1  ORF type:complete len:400 (+),score=50.69 gb/GECG01005273.1/:1-1200(+)
MSCDNSGEYIGYKGALISSSSLSQTTKEALLRSGFQKIAEVQDLSTSQLLKELKVDAKAAKTIVKDIQQVLGEGARQQERSEPDSTTGTCTSASGVGAKRSRTEEDCVRRQQQSYGSSEQPATALDILSEAGTIITFCKPLDAILGGGIPLGEVTEICGVPGVGKTQMCMQLAADCWIPKRFTGVDGSVIYIDTEGSFMIEREAEIASGLRDHLEIMKQKQIRKVGTDAVPSVPKLEELLSRLQVIRCCDVFEQVAAINSLEKQIEQVSEDSPQHPVKLIIIDSLAFHYRHGGDYAGRTKQLISLSQQLHKLASKYSLAVVITNHMTTRFRKDDKSACLVPALGETWSHMCSNRLLLYWAEGERNASLVKSSSRANATCKFGVEKAGVRRVKERPSQSC